MSAFLQRYYLLTLTVFISTLLKRNEGWIFGSKDASSAKTAVALDFKGEAGRFEMKTADDKFLMEAQPFLKLSPLDKCNYRVINHIKKSCSDMAEEELNKMAVHLLNCQLFTENRKMYDCEESMSIADCTVQMDGTMWNAYQIVANRARAVCYATRQQIFRIKTEAAVNKLVSTSQDQILSMEKLTADQQELGQLTEDTLKKVDHSQKEMLQHHVILKSSQNEMENHIVKNLKALTREKALISAGQKEIAEMTEGLKEKLEQTSKTMESQGVQQFESHEEILKDLAMIREQAQEVMDRMSGNAATLDEYQALTHAHYKDTLATLVQVNQSVNFVLSTVYGLQDGLYTRLGWLEIALGGTGDKVAFLKTVCSHILYLMLAVLSAIFLRTPAFTRLFLIFLIPLNAMAEIRSKASLDFTCMTVFILMTAAANLGLNFALNLFASTASASENSPLKTSSAEVALKRKSRRTAKRSRSRSCSRSRRPTTSSDREDSTSEDTTSTDTLGDEYDSSADPSYAPEESLDSVPSRLSSTLISNAAHLTAKFHDSTGGANTTYNQTSGEGLSSLASRSDSYVCKLGTVVSSAPPLPFPDRSYSDSALTKLMLIPSRPHLAAPDASAPKPSMGQVDRLALSQLFSNFSTLASVPSQHASIITSSRSNTINMNAKPNVGEASRHLTQDEAAKGNLSPAVAEVKSGVQEEDPTRRRSRRTSSSRGRSFLKTPDADVSKGGEPDKENFGEGIRSQSLITAAFGSKNRSMTPPLILSSTVDGRGSKTPPRRPKTPPRLNRQPCSAYTRTGAPCKHSALAGRDLCGVHSTKSPIKL